MQVECNDELGPRVRVVMSRTRGPMEGEKGVGRRRFCDVRGYRGAATGRQRRPAMDGQSYDACGVGAFVLSSFCFLLLLESSEEGGCVGYILDDESTLVFGAHKD